MRTARRIFTVVTVALVAVFPGVAQELHSYKIPRRVYFPPATITHGVSDPTMKQIPDYLYTEISAQQPIVRVDSSSRANSVVEVSISEPGPKVVVRLLTKGTEVKRVSFVAQDYVQVARFIGKAAAELAPLLGMVEPVIEKTNEQGKPTGNSALIQKVHLADSFARPIELSIEGTTLLRNSGGGSSGASTFGFEAMPVVFHFAYYFSRSVGIDASFLTYYGTRIGFGQPQNSSLAGPYTRALLLLPGVGVEYRSLGTLFATFSGSLYAGYGYVTNISSQPVGSNSSSGFRTFLGTGASTSIFYSMIRFATDFGYNFSPQFALHLGVAMNLSPFGLFGSNPFGYPTNGNSFFLQYLTVGVSYRP